MSRCDVCGNDYRDTLEIRQRGRSGTFDSFECAIQAMAPTCAHCAEVTGVPTREINA